MPAEVKDGKLCKIDVSVNQIIKLECAENLWYASLQDNNLSKTEFSEITPGNYENQQFWDNGISFVRGQKLVLESL